MKRKLQINDRRRALKKPKRRPTRVMFDIETHTDTGFLRSYQRAMIDMINRSCFTYSFQPRNDFGKTIIFPVKLGI